MSEPFLAEIRIMGFNFAPRGWAQCDGQILPINQNQALYSLIGTTYGGDGRTSFALPDLRGRVPIHPDGTHPEGQSQGTETESLTAAEIPAHTHGLDVATSDTANQQIGQDNILATPVSSVGTIYSTTSDNPDTSLRAEAISSTGNGQAHDNMAPFQALNYCIAIQGLFPSRN